jgi:hypothetical protein
MLALAVSSGMAAAEARAAPLKTHSVVQLCAD